MRADTTRIQARTADGSWTEVEIYDDVDQQQNADSWHLLGEWEFDQGSAGSVTLTSVTAGHHRANAVRFEPQGSVR